jgi:hypothetical protein
MQTYHHRQGIWFGGGHVLLLALAIVGGACGAGLVLFVVSQFVYLILIFPVAMGFINGAFLAKYVHRWKVPHVSFTIVCAVIMALSAYGTFQYASYIQFREATRAAIGREIGTTDFDQTNKAVDLTLEDVTGAQGFMGYLRFQAATGIAIRRLTSSTGGIHLQGALAWLYWAIELAIVGAIGILMVKDTAKRPFCATCRSWYRFDHIGSIDASQEDVVIAAMRSGAYASVADQIGDQTLPPPSLEVYLGQCACRDGDELFSVSRAELTTRKSLQIRDIFQCRVFFSEASALRQRAEKAA